MRKFFIFVLLSVTIAYAGLGYQGGRSVWKSPKTGERFVVWKNCQYGYGCTLVLIIQSNGIVCNFTEQFDPQYGWYYSNREMNIEFISGNKAIITWDDGSSSTIYLTN